MRRARSVSHFGWMCFAMSALLCVGVWWVRHRWQPVRWTGDDELAALTVERNQLSRFDDTTRDALRAQQRTLTQPGWTQERLSQAASAVAPGWRCVWQPPESSFCRAVFTRVTSRLGDWPQCLAFAHQWAAKPGVSLDAIEIVATSSGMRRHFTTISFGVRFMLAAAPNRNAERAAPSRGSLPVAAAVEPATTRPVGLGPSLRRPSASAEPPATGPVSAPFPPDPPGVRAGTGSSVSPHPSIEKSP